MRALLIVNPHATSTTRLRRDVIVRALSSAVELEVVETRYRGHATSLAAAARSDGFGLVLTLGGDGTVNEAVNGILGGAPAAAAAVTRRRQPPPSGRSGAGRAARRATPTCSPAPWACPPIRWTRPGRCSRRSPQGVTARIGLGLAGDRYFTFNAGLGLDAEVVRAVDGHRARGRAATPALYLRMILRQFYRVTDRRHPALTLERDGHPAGRPVVPRHRVQHRALDVPGPPPGVHQPDRPPSTRGLDLFALRSLGTVSTLRTASQMLSATYGRRTGAAS